MTDELRDLSVRACRAVGGGIVAVDLFETPGGLLVNEVNYTMEFRNSIDTTGVNIPGLVVEHVLRVGQAEQERRVRPDGLADMIRIIDVDRRDDL